MERLFTGILAFPGEKVFLLGFEVNWFGVGTDLAGSRLGTRRKAGGGQDKAN